MRLAADIGGTFTDIAVFDDKTGTLSFGKTLSTPQRLVDGMGARLAGLASGETEADLIDADKQGTTITYRLKLSVLEDALLGFAQTEPRRHFAQRLGALFHQGPT